MKQNKTRLNRRLRMLKQAGHRWVFIWAITVLLLYSLIWFFGVSQMQTNRSQRQQQIQSELATLQPVTSSRTAQTPDTIPSDEVVAGVYINQIGNISVKDVSFKVDFDLWFRWNGTTLNPVDTFQLIDGEVESKEKVASVIRGEEHYDRYRIIAQVNKSFDTSRFPFSDEWFLIHIELGDSAKRTTQLIADQQASGQSALAVPPALSIRQTLIGVKLLISPSTFGDPRLASKQSGVKSRLTYAMQVQPVSFRIYFPIFQALFGAVAIALIAGASLVIGHLLGGSDPNTRATLAIANTTRNAGLALVITVLNFTRAEILPTVIVYALISAIAVAIYNNRYKRTLDPAKD